MKVLVSAIAVVAMFGLCVSASSEGLPSVAPTAIPQNNLSPPAAADAVKVLQDVCLPLIKGGDLKDVAHGAGLKLEDGQWTLPIAGKRRIDLQPPDVANPHVCTATITHKIGDQPAILRAVSQWAGAQTPPLQPIKVQERSNGVTYQRTTSSWASQTPQGAEGLVFAAEKTLQGKPVADDSDQSELIISISSS